VKLERGSRLENVKPRFAGSRGRTDCLAPTVIAFLAMIASGCIGRSAHEVVVYCALDKEFSEPIFAQFERETGISVRAKYDQESNKTVGLANAILQRGSGSNCDVFWNNEILHTLRLQRAGRLTAIESPRPSSFPADFVDDRRQWCGFAARARILIINTQRLPDETSWPRRVADLGEARWQGQGGMARPLFGTTATHAAVLFDRLGEPAALDFFRAVKQHAVIEGGNKQVARRVALGELAFGLTDTDDALIELEQGMPVAIVFPDQGEGESGTLFIPNTIAPIHGSRRAAAANRLIDYVLSPQVEQQLAAGPSGQIPLSSDLAGSPHRLGVVGKRAMPVDFAKAAAGWDERAKWLADLFGL
jgi:iron(III) transport system substrate-binding protein